MSEIIPVSGSSALAGASDADETSLLKNLSARLPQYLRNDALLVKRPTPAEMMELLEALPKDQQQKVLELIRKTNPKKQGAHSTTAQFSPTDIKVFQGTGSDPLRPKNAVPGMFYTTESKLLDMEFDAAVISFYRGRTLWPSRDDKNSNVPLCTSMDQKYGSKFGECATCPKSRMLYTQGGCQQEVVVTLVDRELTGIYRLRFMKSSEPAGKSLTRVAQMSDPIWSRWFRIESTERVDGTKRYYVIKTNPVADQKKPENETVSEPLRALFNAFSRLVDCDVFYPGIANIYTPPSRGEGEAAVEEGEAAETVDLSKGASSKGDKPDYSM